MAVDDLLGNVRKIGPIAEKYTLFWNDRGK